MPTQNEDSKYLVNIQDYFSICDKQIESFNDLVAKFKSINLEMEKCVEESKFKNRKLIEKLTEIDEIKRNNEKKLADTEKSLEDSKTVLGRAKQKEIEADSELSKLNERDKDLTNSEASINSQRDEVIKQQQELQDHFKWIKMEERNLKATRLEIDKIIRDNKLREQFGE